MNVKPCDGTRRLGLLCGLLMLLCAADHARAQSASVGETASASVDAPDDDARLVIAQQAQAKFDDGMALLSSDPVKAQQFFRESAGEYQRLVDMGIHNGELFFNLASARIQSGERGAGIGALLDAQRLLPGDQRVATNLAHARSLISTSALLSAPLTPIDRVASLWSGSQWSSLSTRVWASAVLWGALWLVIAAGVATGWHRRVPWRAAIGATSALCLLVAATVSIDLLREQMDPFGVVLHDGVIARKGNGDGFAPAFTDPLDQGVEFRLVESRPGWYRIELHDGESAWINSADAHVTGQQRPQPAGG